MIPSSLGLSTEDLDSLLTLLDRFVPNAEIWAFGSRVNGTARPFSDLDLVIVQNDPLDFQLKAELRHALSESSLSFKVDIVDWARTKLAFRKQIQQNHVVLKSPSSTA